VDEFAIYDRQLCSCCPEWLGSQVPTASVWEVDIHVQMPLEYLIMNHKVAVSGGFLKFLESSSKWKVLAASKGRSSVKEQAKYVKLYPFQSEVFTLCLRQSYDLSRSSGRLQSWSRKQNNQSTVGHSFFSWADFSLFQMPKFQPNPKKGRGYVTRKSSCHNRCRTSRCTKESPFTVSDAKVETTTTNRSKPKSERFQEQHQTWSSACFQEVRRLILTDSLPSLPHQCISSATSRCVWIKQRLRNSRRFLQSSRRYHDIKMMWELGDLVFNEWMPSTGGMAP